MTLIFGLIYGVIFVNDNQSEEVFAAEIPSSTASMSIENPTLSSNSVTPNSIAYLSTNVTINTQYIQSYSLTISGNPNLSGPTVITGTSTNTTPANMTNNTWGYNWGATNTTDSTLSYSSLSATAATLALDALTNGAANFTKKLTFAVKFGNADTGHYTNDVTLSFTANPKTLIDYSVTYDVNGGIGGPANYSEQSYDTSKSYTIPDTQPVRDGYNFLGWSTSPTATTADANYAPEKNITLTQASPTMKLYAAWKERPFSGITNLQQMTSEICTTATIGDSTTLVDTRDGSDYTVAKLADGKCWMTQNLRITRESIQAKTSTNTTGIITSADSNVNTNYSIPASITGGFSDAKSNGYYTNQQVRAAAAGDIGRVYGAYYSHNVATVNSVSTSSNTTAVYDICPKGWRLPMSTGSTWEYDELYKKGNTQVGNMNNATLNSITDGWWLGTSTSGSAGGAFFPAASTTYTGGFSGGGSNGWYWYGTVAGPANAYALGFSSGNSISTANSTSRYGGLSVRCVAQ